MKNLYFITGNQGKFAEIQKIIPGILQKNIDLPEIQELSTEKIIAEKLKVAESLLKENLFVEDGFFNLSCLNNFPGPLIKWFYKSISNEDIFNICAGFNNFDVEVGITIGLKLMGDEVRFFTGRSKGKVVSPRGSNGFSWDPIFQPEGFDKTYGEMNIEEKNTISMRKMAAEKLKAYLDLHDQEN